MSPARGNIEEPCPWSEVNERWRKGSEMRPPNAHSVASKATRVQASRPENLPVFSLGYHGRNRRLQLRQYNKGNRRVVTASAVLRTPETRGPDGRALARLPYSGITVESMSHHSFPRSSILVLGLDSLQSLFPSTLISQVDSLLESHSLEAAYNLVDERRKKLEETLHVDEDDVRIHFVSFRFFINANQASRQRNCVTCTRGSDFNASLKLCSMTPGNTCSTGN